MSRNPFSPESNSDRRRNPTLRRIRIGMVLLIVGYVLAQPWLEQQFGWSLPSIAKRNKDAPAVVDRGPEVNGAVDDSGDARQAGDPAAAALAAGQLKLIRRDVFESPAGLIYTPGSQHGHRLKHVLAHTEDQPDRPGQHGVFRDPAPATCVRLIDEAYRESLTGKADSSGTDSERQVWTVDMGRDIGYVGGQVGQQRGHPSCYHLRIVLDGKRVITAYPVHQRKRR